MRCCRCRISARLLLVAFASAVAATPSPAQGLSPVQLAALAQPGGEEELLLEVMLNGAPTPAAVLVLRTADGRFHVTAATLLGWRVRVPSVPVRERFGAAWLPLDAIDGAQLRYDAPRQRLALTLPAAAFEASRVDAARDALPRTARPAPGGFLNYAAVGSRVAGASSWGAQVEAGVFGPHGVVVAGALAQDDDFERRVVRLDTTYTLDFPARLETLRVGDAVSVPGAWGRALRVGGVQWGSNFALQPGFVAFPTFTARGESALPSTVDVFVNNALVAQQPVPPGPFSIANIPTVTGAGDVQLVVRDLLGREVVISQPFYASSDLLAPGLAQYSLEAGAEREDFGRESFGYGDAYAAATWRQGLTPRVTVEARGEATRDLVAAGAAIDWLANAGGVVSATAAVSESRDAGAGWLAGAGYSFQTRDGGLTLRGRWSSAEWRQAGVTELSPVPRVELAASATTRIGRFGSLAATYVGQRFREREDNRFATLSWTAPLPRGSALSVLALRNLDRHSTSLSVVVTVPFGARDTASVGWYGQRGRDGDDDDTEVLVQRALPVGEGFGYRVYARSRDDVQASVAWQGEVGTYTAEATRFGDANGVRLSVSGGVGVIGGHAFASREITESFGVVRVADFDGVGILLENQPAATTRRGGHAVLPRLRAYDANRIGIVQGDLPLDAAIDALDVQAVPSYRSGVLVDFPVRRARGATLTIVQPDGAPVPAGSTLVLDDASRTFPVGADGAAYVEGLRPRNRATVYHRDMRCAFDLRFEPSADPLPDLGRHVCVPVAEAK